MAIMGCFSSGTVDGLEMWDDSQCFSQVSRSGVALRWTGMAIPVLCLDGRGGIGVAGNSFSSAALSHSKSPYLRFTVDAVRC